MATSFLRPLVFHSPVWQREALSYFCYLVLINIFINDLGFECNSAINTFAFLLGTRKNWKFSLEASYFPSSFLKDSEGLANVMKKWEFEEKNTKNLWMRVGRKCCSFIIRISGNNLSSLNCYYNFIWKNTTFCFKSLEKIKNFVMHTFWKTSKSCSLWLFSFHTVKLVSS